MGMEQLVVAAVLVEGRSKSEVARTYGVSRRWVITLVQRYLAEGDEGLRPRSRRPVRSPNLVPDDHLGGTSHVGARAVVGPGAACKPSGTPCSLDGAW